jgi:hypothetical protein
MSIDARKSARPVRKSRVTIPLADLLAMDPDIRRMHEINASQGYVAHDPVRLYRGQHGRFSARVVWRRGSAKSPFVSIAVTARYQVVEE